MKSFFTLFFSVGIFVFTFSQNPNVYYPFNGNANDASGNNHHGEVFGAQLTSDRNGNANNAYLFNGSTDYIEVADTNALNFGKGSFTISLWFKTNSNQAYMFPVATGVQGFAPGIVVSVNYGGVLGCVLLAVGGNQVGDVTNTILIHTTETTFADNQWHHFVGVVDKTNLKARIYIDGTLRTITKYTNFGPVGGTLINGNTELDITNVDYKASPSHRFYIVRSNNTSIDQSFNGSIDDINIFSAALNATQVNTLFTTNFSIENALQSSNFEIYPNPVNTQLNLLSNNQISHINILSIDGKLVQAFTNTNNQFHVANLKSGIYILESTTVDGKVGRKMFIKQ
jgi:hypothetical protein